MAGKKSQNDQVGMLVFAVQVWGDKLCHFSYRWMGAGLGRLRRSWL